MEMCSNKHMHQKYTYTNHKKEHSNKIIFHFGFVPSDCVQCKCVHVYEIFVLFHPYIHMLTCKYKG